MGNCCGSNATVPSEPSPQLQIRLPRPAEHQPSSSSLDGSNQGSSVVSATHASGGNEKHAPALVQDNRGTVPTRTSTSPSSHHAPTPSRVLSQDPFSQRKPLHLSGLTRTNSVNLLGNGHTPQPGSFLSARAGEGQKDRQPFPSTLQSLLSNVRYAVGHCPISPRQLSSTVHHRFRILVVGKVRVIYQTTRRN